MGNVEIFSSYIYNKCIFVYFVSKITGFQFFVVFLQDKVQQNMMLQEVCENTERFIEQMPKEQRKQYGQFFTSMETARFMASLFTIDSGKQVLYALDAGAGSGILSVALIERCNEILHENQVLDLVCYENDKNVISLLKENLSIAKQECRFLLRITIIEDNYILSQRTAFERDLFVQESFHQYDLIIGNPPYKKIGKDALEALAISEVCYGAPNLYFLFATMGVKNLKNDAEMVYIIPRSWLHKLKVPYRLVVSNNHYYVHLVTDEEEVKSLQSINHFKNTLVDLGLKMKTGLVVDFRTRDLLRDKEDVETIPLIYSLHIKNGRVRFPQGAEKEYIVKDRKGLMQENRNYLFVKRFTAKEEHRRLQCGIYLKRYLPSFHYISSQNKVNFIDGLQGLSECMVYGLYVIFNSTLYDVYYRILNGSTQVNSTEINAMPVPSIDIIEAMGKQLIASNSLSVEQCNDILNSYYC